VIEPTDEMVQLALDVFLATPTDSIAQIDAGMAKALAAVLAIVERDYYVSPRPTPEQLAALPKPKRRLRACVEQWPEAETGDYDPRCCRFPKSCSATVYHAEGLIDADLEPER
jgi:hypothetical protein